MRELRSEAKEQLEKALVLAQTKEREYRDALEDVRRKLDALELPSDRPAENQPPASANAPVEIEAAGESVTPIQIQSVAPDFPVVKTLRGSTQRFSKRWGMTISAGVEG